MKCLYMFKFTLRTQKRLEVENTLGNQHMFIVHNAFSLPAWQTVKIWAQAYYELCDNAMHQPITEDQKPRSPWNTEVLWRARSRSIMSLENSLLSPCGKHFLQEQKKLEAHFPQGRNMLPAMQCNSLELNKFLQWPIHCLVLTGTTNCKPVRRSCC